MKKISKKSKSYQRFEEIPLWIRRELDLIPGEVLPLKKAGPTVRELEASLKRGRPQ